MIIIVLCSAAVPVAVSVLPSSRTNHRREVKRTFIHIKENGAAQSVVFNWAAALGFTARRRIGIASQDISDRGESRKCTSTSLQR